MTETNVKNKEIFSKNLDYYMKKKVKEIIDKINKTKQLWEEKNLIKFLKWII